MRDIYLHADEKEYLNKKYKIGDRYRVDKIIYLDDCDYLKEGLTGILTEIDNMGFFIFKWDNNFNTQGEYPNWLEGDRITKNK